MSVSRSPNFVPIDSSYTTTCCCLDKSRVYQRMAKTANHVGRRYAVIIGPRPHWFHELQSSWFDVLSAFGELTASLWRVDCVTSWLVTSWPCDELTGSLPEYRKAPQITTSYRKSPQITANYHKSLQISRFFFGGGVQFLFVGVCDFYYFLNMAACRHHRRTSCYFAKLIEASPRPNGL